RRSSDLTKAFQQIKGRKRSSFNPTTKEKSVKGLVSKYIQTILACLVAFMVAYFLFRSFLPSILIAALGLFYPKLKARRDEKKLKDIMLLQFREAILSMSSSLRAGSSLQTAFQRSESDLERELQFQRDTPMLDALKKIN